MAKSKYSVPSVPGYILGFLSGTVLVAALFLAVYMVTSKTSLSSLVKADYNCASYTKGKAVKLLHQGTVSNKNVNSFTYTTSLNQEVPKIIVVCSDTVLLNRDKVSITVDQVKNGDQLNYLTGYVGDTTGNIILASYILDSTQVNSQTITDSFTGVIVPSKGYKGYIGGFDTNKWQVIGAQGTSVFQSGGTLNVKLGANVAATAYGGVDLIRSVVAGNDFDSTVDVKNFTASSNDHPKATAELKFYGNDTNWFDALWVRDTSGSYVVFYGSNNGQWFESPHTVVPEGGAVHLHLSRTGNSVKGFATVGTGTETQLGAAQTVNYTGSLQPQLLVWKSSPAGTAALSASFDNFSVSGALQ